MGRNLSSRLSGYYFRLLWGVLFRFGLRDGCRLRSWIC